VPCHSMSRDCIRAEPTELSARQRRLTGVARRIAALDSWREIMHEPDLLAGTLADLPGIRKPVTNQEKDGPLRGAMPGMKLGAGPGSARGLPWVRRMGLGGRCMLGLACRPSSPGHFGPFEAVTKFGAGVPVAGHARCCCERVCQSPD
jgi:hypothetical protein